MILHLLPVNASHYTKADLALHYIINLKNLVKSLLNKNIAPSPIRAALQTPSHILCIMKLHSKFFWIHRCELHIHSPFNLTKNLGFQTYSASKTN